MTTPDVRQATTVEERVAFIADVMARGMWITRTTAKQLASEWGVAKTTVEHYAAEASRMVRADRGTIDQVRDGQLAKLEMIALQAVAKKEYRTAVAAIEAAAKIGGTLAAQKHEVSGVLLSAAWLELRGTIEGLLAPFPEALAALLQGLAAGGGAKERAEVTTTEGAEP